MNGLPDGFEPVSALPRGLACEALDRTLRTTHDAIRFTDALARTLGDRAYECTWTKRNGSRRLYARDLEHPGWIVSTALLELSLDVAEPPAHTRQILLPDGTLADAPFPSRPRPQPEGPDQRSAELRLIDGERVAQWSFDAAGRLRERTRGVGDLVGADALPMARDRRLLWPSAQRPLPVFLRPDLDPDGHSPSELAERVAATLPTSAPRIRAWVPHPVPGGPALAARRVVWELRRASLAGRFSYGAAGWVVADGYLGDVLATGSTLHSAFVEWQRAMAMFNPVPRDSRVTPAEAARFARELEEEEEDERDEGGGGPQVEASEGKVRIGMKMRIVLVPPREMPWPPRRPECAPAIAIRLPEPPRLPDEWRRAGFERVIRLLDEEGTVEHGFVAPGDGPGFLFVGERAARHLDPATLRGALSVADRVADEADRAVWGDLQDEHRERYPWTTSHFTMLAPDGRSVGPLRRTTAQWNPEPDLSGFEPQQTWSVAWCRPGGSVRAALPSARHLPRS